MAQAGVSQPWLAKVGPSGDRIRKLLDKQKRFFSLEQVSEAAPSYFEVTYIAQKGEQYSSVVFSELEKASASARGFIELVASIAKSFDSEPDKESELPV